MGALNNAAYRMLNRVDTLLASGRLRSLRDANLLEQKGKGSGTYYVSGPRILAASGSVVTSRSASHTIALSAGGPALSAGGPAFGADFAALRNELPPELQEQLDELGKRATPAFLDETICSLCAWRTLTLRELAYLTGRKGNHLRQRSLKRLISSGRLQYTHPEQIDHPQQAYRARAKKRNR
jgi:ATP-dependent DNA helicase RecG